MRGRPEVLGGNAQEEQHDRDAIAVAHNPKLDGASHKATPFEGFATLRVRHSLYFKCVGTPQPR